MAGASLDDASTSMNGPQSHETTQLISHQTNNCLAAGSSPRYSFACHSFSTAATATGLMPKVSRAYDSRAYAAAGVTAGPRLGLSELLVLL